jgi:hypothetical protein
MHKRILLVLLLLATSGFAQKPRSKGEAPDNKDLGKYLNDGRVGNVSNLVRFRLGTAVAGYFGLSYERKFGRKFGMEVGASFKPLKGAFFENYRLADGNYSDIYGGGTLELSNVSGGVGFLAYPKLYVSGKKINNGYFFGLKTTMRNYTADGSRGLYGNYVQKGIKASSTAVFFTAGSHQHIGNRFVFGMEWGLGYIQDTFNDMDKENYDFTTSTHSIVHTHDKLTVLSGAFSLDMVLGVLF